MGAGEAHELDDLVDPARDRGRRCRRRAAGDVALVGAPTGSRPPAGTRGRTPRRRCGPCRWRRTGSSPPPAGSPATRRAGRAAGTCSSPSLITVMSTLSVSSGTAVDLLDVEQRAVAQRAMRAGRRRTRSGRSPRPAPGPGRSGRRAGPGSARRCPRRTRSPTPSSWATARSSVDLPVPGGPSMQDVAVGDRARRRRVRSRGGGRRRSPDALDERGGVGGRFRHAVSSCPVRSRGRSRRGCSRRRASPGSRR